MLPTKENVDMALKLYDMLPNWKTADKVIRKYISDHKANKNIHYIAVKVALINDLYSARVLAPMGMAEHIKKKAEEGLDDLILKGNIKAVDIIENAKIYRKKKRFLSFASKYCHFHNPDAYPMFDSYVFTSISKINGREKRLNVQNSKLREYYVFYSAFMTLREKANLEKYSVNQIDKYLWLWGQKISKKRDQLASDIRECFHKNKNLVERL